MNDSKRVYVITAIAALFMFTIMGVAGMWIYAERGINQLMPTAGLCRVGGVVAGEAGERGRHAA